MKNFVLLSAIGFMLIIGIACSGVVEPGSGDSTRKTSNPDMVDGLDSTSAPSLETNDPTPKEADIIPSQNESRSTGPDENVEELQPTILADDPSIDLQPSVEGKTVPDDDAMSERPISRVISDAERLASKVLGEYYPGGELLTDGWTVHLGAGGEQLHIERARPEIIWIVFHRERLRREIVWKCTALQIGNEMRISLAKPDTHVEVYRYEIESPIAFKDENDRVWTSADGQFGTVGHVVKYDPVTNIVTLRKKDGQEITIEIDKLALKDRNYVRNLAREEK